AFEDQIRTDERWMLPVPNDLIGVLSSMLIYRGSEYVVVYNVDTSEYNTLPQESGRYNFINIVYDPNERLVTIVEYDIEYVK
ncbi:MAG: hypothetical protein IJP17_07825, partial [Clostridia bacterium]|nr:hypothetical protein [Clostridia bacterium]